MIAEIDETTGLPVLPEGHFWRVERNALRIMRSEPASEWSGWASGSGSNYGEYSAWGVEHRTRQEPRRWPRKPVTLIEYRTRRAARNVDVVVNRYGEWVWEFRAWRCVEPDPITAENLHERALETLVGWRFDQAVDALLGDYPPKRFEVSE